MPRPRLSALALAMHLALLTCGAAQVSYPVCAVSALPDRPAVTARVEEVLGDDFSCRSNGTQEACFSSACSASSSYTVCYKGGCCAEVWEESGQDGSRTVVLYNAVVVRSPVFVRCVQHSLTA
jgi:hypothetical protein